MTNQPPPPPYNPPGSPMGGAAAGPKPDNYLVWAILSTLFCCLPLGIASIVFAAQVDGKYNSGDYAGAQDRVGEGEEVRDLGSDRRPRGRRAVRRPDRRCRQLLTRRP